MPPHAGPHEEAPGPVRSRRREGSSWPRAFIVTSMEGMGESRQRSLGRLRMA